MKTELKNLNEELRKANYKSLGWQNDWKQDTDYPQYKACRDAKHQTDNVSHDNRGTENTISCDICKIYWKYDCSD